MSKFGKKTDACGLTDGQKSHVFHTHLELGAEAK